MHASREWQAFLAEVKDGMMLESSHMAYTAVDGVLQVFRRRLTAQEGLDFASVLPCVPRAIFVHRWDVSGPVATFGDRASLVAEVRQVRSGHNLTPDNAIDVTALAVWRFSNTQDLRGVLERLPEGSKDFWHVEVADDAALERSIV